MSKRKDFTQLPDSEELQDILGRESQRPLLPRKEEIHYPDFPPIIRLFEYLDIPTGIFTQGFTADDLKDRDIVSWGKDLIEKAKNKIPALELGPEEQSLFNDVYAYLSEEDPPQKADLIFVFGSKTPLRAEKAAELYNKNLASLVMVSGGSPIYVEDQETSEAQRYKQILTSRGVPEQQIITEEQSISIPDNVRSSLNLLDDEGITYRSMILVNSPYVQRRGWAHFKKYLPDSVKLIRVNSDTGEQYQRDNWYKNENGINVILNEFVKMKVAVILNTT